MKSVRIILLAAAAAVTFALAGAQEGRRDGDERGGRDILCVVPIAKAPEADALAALEKVFGKLLKVAVDKDLKVVVLQGPEGSVVGAVQALRESIDTTPPPRLRDGDVAERAAGPSIDVVRLRKAKADTVTKLIKQYVAGKVQITERPNVPALIIEGDGPAVAQAASLARQLDGQQVHPSLRRILQPAEGERPREGDRAKPKGDGDVGKPKKDGDREKP